MNYQNLNSYAGSLYGEPSYQGVEYSYDVPDNLVVGSPGGVSAVYHDWTNGLYGRGNTSSDIYAGQQDRYISGNYGSMYNTGQSAGDAMGYYTAPPDYQYWQNEVPQQYSYSKSSASIGPTAGMSTQKKAHIEGYESGLGDDFDLIEGADDLGNELSMEDEIEIIGKDVASIKSTLKTDSATPPWVIFLFLILLFIAFDFWAEAGHRFISQRFHDGGVPTWERSVLYAVGVTAIFVLIIWMVGVPITTFESI